MRSRSSNSSENVLDFCDTMSDVTYEPLSEDDRCAGTLTLRNGIIY
jgi:hypothetical protein